jgi:hypothetical protein
VLHAQDKRAVGPWRKLLIHAKIFKNIFPEWKFPEENDLFENVKSQGGREMRK